MAKENQVRKSPVDHNSDENQTKQIDINERKW